MIKEAEVLAKLDPEKIVIKLPLTEEGLKATKALSQKGFKTNLTLIFSPLQALLAAKAGATYVSPFVGRQHVLQAGFIGADICTIPYSVMLQLAKHPLTDIGLEKFLADWQKHVSK